MKGDDNGAGLKGVRDQQTVTNSGEVIQQLPEGVSFYDVTTQVDERGSLVELYDPRWNWHPAPMVYAYYFTVSPGIIKGWGMHLEHDDCYFLLTGEMEVHLYDDRTDSPTRGLVASVVMSEYQRRVLCIPAGIWHADRSIGSRDATGVNFPTQPYDHAHPDKYRLPPNNDFIPSKFGNPRGG